MYYVSASGRSRARGWIAFAASTALTMSAAGASAQQVLKATPAPDFVDQRLDGGAGTDQASGAAAPSAPAAADPDAATIVVTASKLNAARAAIQPELGASSYSFDSTAIEALPRPSRA